MLPSGRTIRARHFAPVHLAALGSIYDIQRAVADKATVPILYEGRISKLILNAAGLATWARPHNTPNRNRFPIRLIWFLAGFAGQDR